MHQLTVCVPCGGTALAAFDFNPLPFEAGRRWRHLRLTHTIVANALAAFQMITFPCGRTALAAFEVNPLPFEAGRRWRHLRLTHTLVAGRRWRHFR